MTPEHGTAALGPTSTAGKAVKTGSPDAADSTFAEHPTEALHDAAAFLRPCGPRWVSWKLQHLRRPRTGELQFNPDGTPKLGKVPAGSTLQASEWCELPPDARSDATAGWGFVTTGGVQSPDGWLVALDIDNCRNPQTGELAPWAQRIVDHYRGTYVEVTPSGTGIRVWLIVRERANIGKRVPPAGTAPMPGVAKAIEIDPFGTTDAARYVTFTGRKLPGAGDVPLVVDNLDWLAENYEAKHKAPTEDAGGPPPEPVGPAVTPEAIREAVLARKNGPQLIAGEWAALDYASASEAYWALVQHALLAGNGHELPVVKFLLWYTTFGAGRVDSADPGKYEKRDWVERQVAKAARTSTRLAEIRNRADGRGAFEPLEGGERDALLDTAAEVAAAGPVLVDPLQRFAELRDSADDGVLVRSLLAKGRVINWGGPPKLGKSTLLMAALYGFTLDEPRALDGFGKPSRPLRILYLSENHPDDDAVTLSAFQADTPQTGDGLFRMLNIGAVPPAVRGSWLALLRWVADIIREHRFDGVVWDTLDHWTPDVEDSNSAAQVATTYGSLSTIIAKGCNVAVLCVLHAKKGGEPLSFDSILGSVKFRGSSDGNIVLTRADEDDPKSLEVVLRREARDPWALLAKACGGLPASAPAAVRHRDNDAATRLAYRLTGQLAVDAQGREVARCAYVRIPVPQHLSGRSETAGTAPRLSREATKAADDELTRRAFALRAADRGGEPVSHERLLSDGTYQRALDRWDDRPPGYDDPPGPTRARQAVQRLESRGELQAHGRAGRTLAPGPFGPAGGLCA